jgi:hypothetical protein
MLRDPNETLTSATLRFLNRFSFSEPNIAVTAWALFGLILAWLRNIMSTGSDVPRRERVPALG